MNLALRPLGTILALTLAAGAADAAKKKPLPAAPAACTDFYGHINHAWLQTHPPSASNDWSRWDELNELAARQRRALLTETSSPIAGAATDALANLIASGLDEIALESAGQAVLQPMLERIDRTRKSKELAPTVAMLNAQGVPILFTLQVRRDPGMGQGRATLLPNGLGLSDPEFYTGTDPQLQRIRTLYRAYLAELLKLAGVPEAKASEQAGWALARETELAKTLTTPAQESLTLAQAIKTYPQLSLANYLQGLGAAPEKLDIPHPAYFKALNRMFDKPAIDQWQAYLRAQTLHALAPSLAAKFRQAHALMFDIALRAKTASPTHTEQVAELVSAEATELLNLAYAERYLDPARAQKAEAIATQVQAAMRRAIDRAAWLSADGKATAHSKLAALRFAIGPARESLAYDGPRLDRAQYAANLLALRRWRQAKTVASLTHSAEPWPLDQTRPLIGYAPRQNQVVVTAAALQAPVFANQSTAGDYGTLGALIAQQLSVAFNRFEGEDSLAWQTHIAPLAVPAETGANLSNRSLQSTTVADLAGLELAWDALMTQGPLSPPASKEFFGGWAALWARQDQSLPTSSKTEVPPAKLRVNEPLSRLPAFQESYGCRPGQAMFRPASDRIAIWR